MFFWGAEQARRSQESGTWPRQARAGEVRVGKRERCRGSRAGSQEPRAGKSRRASRSCPVHLCERQPQERILTGDAPCTDPSSKLPGNFLGWAAEDSTDALQDFAGTVSNFPSTSTGTSCDPTSTSACSAAGAITTAIPASGPPAAIAATPRAILQRASSELCPRYGADRHHTHGGATSAGRQPHSSSSADRGLARTEVTKASKLCVAKEAQAAVEVL